MKVSASHWAQPTWQKRPQEVRLKGGPETGHSTHAGGHCNFGPAPGQKHGRVYSARSIKQVCTRRVLQAFLASWGGAVTLTVLVKCTDHCVT